MQPQQRSLLDPAPSVEFPSECIYSLDEIPKIPSYFPLALAFCVVIIYLTHILPAVLLALTLASDSAVLYRNAVLPILVLSTKKRYSSFLKRVCVFQKIYLKVKALKSFKISSDCHIKTYQTLKWRLFQKSLVHFFRRAYGLSDGFKMKPLSKSIFLR